MPIPFLGKPTTAEIDRRIDALSQKRSKNINESNSIQAHVTKLEAELSSLELEAVLEDSPTAAKSAAELKPRIEKLKSKARELVHDLELIDAALSKLRERRASAEQTEVKERFQDKCKALISVSRKMDPLIAALAEHARDAATLAAECQSLARPYTNSSTPSTCNDSLNDAFLATLKHQFKGIRVEQIVVMHHALEGVQAGDGSMSVYLQSRLDGEMRKLQLGLEKKSGLTTEDAFSDDDMNADGFEDADLAKSE